MNHPLSLQEEQRQKPALKGEPDRNNKTDNQYGLLFSIVRIFGGSIALVGMLFAYGNSVRGRGHVPVVVSSLKERLPDALLTVLMADNQHNDAAISTAINAAHGKPVAFLYLAEPRAKRAPRLFEVVDPYLDDQPAKETLKHAALLAREAGLTTRFVYRQQEPGVAASLWQTIRPHDVVLAAEDARQCAEINPDLIRYELTSQGKIAHLLKHW